MKKKYFMLSAFPLEKSMLKKMKIYKIKAKGRLSGVNV